MHEIIICQLHGLSVTLSPNRDSSLRLADSLYENGFTVIQAVDVSSITTDLDQLPCRDVPHETWNEVFCLSDKYSTFVIKIFEITRWSNSYSLSMQVDVLTLGKFRWIFALQCQIKDRFAERISVMLFSRPTPKFSCLAFDRDQSRPAYRLRYQIYR